MRFLLTITIQRRIAFLLAAVLSFLSGPLFLCECRGIVVSTSEVLATIDCCETQSCCPPESESSDHSEPCNQPLPWEFYSPETSDRKPHAPASLLIPQRDLATPGDSRFLTPHLPLCHARRGPAFPGCHGSIPVYLYLRILLI